MLISYGTIVYVKLIIKTVVRNSNMISNKRSTLDQIFVFIEVENNFKFKDKDEEEAYRLLFINRMERVKYIFEGMINNNKLTTKERAYNTLDNLLEKEGICMEEEISHEGQGFVQVFFSAFHLYIVDSISLNGNRNPSESFELMKDFCISIFTDHKF
jgi:hypothetical protein